MEAPFKHFLQVPRRLRVWRTAKGVEMSVASMSDGHVCNTVNMLIRRARANWIDKVPGKRSTNWYVDFEHKRALAWMLDETKTRGIEWVDKTDEHYFGHDGFFTEAYVDPVWLDLYRPRPEGQQVAGVGAGVGVQGTGSGPTVHTSIGTVANPAAAVAQASLDISERVRRERAVAV